MHTHTGRETEGWEEVREKPVCCNLFHQQLLIELLDEVDFLGPVQLVLERLQHIACFNAEHLEGDVTSVGRLLVNQKHDALRQPCR